MAKSENSERERERKTLKLILGKPRKLDALAYKVIRPRSPTNTNTHRAQVVASLLRFDPQRYTRRVRQTESSGMVVLVGERGVVL